MKKSDDSHSTQSSRRSSPALRKDKNSTTVSNSRNLDRKRRSEKLVRGKDKDGEAAIFMGDLATAELSVSVLYLNRHLFGLKKVSFILTAHRE